METKMTDLELVSNFISQYNRPFNVESAASLVGLSAEAVAPVMAEMLQRKEIKRISESEGGIYVRANRYDTSQCSTITGWTFNVTSAYQLMDIIESGNYYGIRPLAKAIGKSRQWVYIYLEALASLGAVDLRNYKYVVINREKAPYIGTKVQKGILHQLRSLNRMGAHRDLS
jgi:hypothetical protein